MELMISQQGINYSETPFLPETLLEILRLFRNPMYSNYQSEKPCRKYDGTGRCYFVTYFLVVLATRCLRVHKKINILISYCLQRNCKSISEESQDFTHVKSGQFERLCPSCRQTLHRFGRPRFATCWVPVEDRRFRPPPPCARPSNAPVSRCVRGLPLGFKIGGL